MLSMIESINSVVNNFIWGVPAMICIIGVGLYLSIRTRFLQIRKFPYSMKVTLGRMMKKKEASDGALTPFQAVCTALAATIGTGNVAGVAGAIAIGGPGAVFWMWVWAFVGMTIKHAEVTLGCYYRSKDSQGKLYGGPTFYMEKGIVIEKGQKWGWILVIGFAVGMVLQFLGGSQAYNIAESLYETFGFDQIVFVLLYSAFLLYIIWKGVPRIAKVASRLVPFMCVLYLLGGIVMCPRARLPWV